MKSAAERLRACPTCSGPVRETVGMVCQTCGTDYAQIARKSESSLTVTSDRPVMTPVTGGHTQENWSSEEVR